MKPAPDRIKLTYDDFLLFPDDGKRHELIDGEHYVTPSPNTKHQRVSGNLFFLMRAWLEEHPIGQVFYAPFDVVFSRFDVVEPDLLYVSNERMKEIVTAQHVTGAPDIVVEIGSPGTRKRDETIKRRLYERSGVSEYWVLDPALDVVRVYRREGAAFTRPVELSTEAGDVLTTPHLAGLELPLDASLRHTGLAVRARSPLVSGREEQTGTCRPRYDPRLYHPCPRSVADDRSPPCVSRPVPAARAPAAAGPVPAPLPSRSRRPRGGQTHLQRPMRLVPRH